MADAKYKIELEVDVIYLSSDVHDQSFYEMFAEIFDAAERAYPKYKFEIVKHRMKEQPK